MAVNTAQKLRCTPALVEMLRTRNGCLVRLTVGNRQFAVVNGTVELAKQVTVQWLLASPAKPDAVQYKNVLALRSYDLIIADEITASLDPDTSQQVMENLIAMPCMVVAITHDVAGSFMHQFDKVYRVEHGVVRVA